MEIRSRILKNINKELMIELNSIALDVLIPDNNTKMNLFIAAFEKHNVSYQELGPGTNRGAFLIDGYVFKIGFDKAGIVDNWAEFSLAQELQPFVTKCYECNGLIAVSEYVTVISKEEFNDNKEEVQQILSHLADSYLLGDVGSVTKNFMNWGYRNDGSLVILDYAYIYRVIGDELLCGAMINDEGDLCDGSLEYDQNFHKLICPKCRKNYTFHEIRRKISKDYEEKERNAIKQLAYKLTTPIQKFNNPSTTAINTNIEGDDEMSKYNYPKNDYNYEKEEIQFDESMYEDAIAFMKKAHSHDEDETEDDKVVLIKDIDEIDEVIDEIESSDEYETIDDIHEDDETDFTLDELVEKLGMIEDDDSEEEIDVDEVEDITEVMESVEVDTGSIVSVDEADDPYEEPVSEVTSEDTIEGKFTIAYPDESDKVQGIVVSEPNNDNNVSIDVDTSVDTVNINVNITSEDATTVKLEAGNDTIVLTTPDHIDEMRASLMEDIDSEYEEYENMYNDSSSYQKMSKKKNFK